MGGPKIEGPLYSGPADLKPLCLTVPSILRMAISDNSFIFSIYIPPFLDHLQVKTTFFWLRR